MIEAATTHRLLFLLLLALVLLLGSVSGKRGEVGHGRAISVDVYGDSILRAPGIAVSPVQRIAELRPFWEVTDHSATGLTLHSLLKGYAEPYKAAPPADYPHGPQPPFVQVPRSARVVVVALGGNDALNMRSVQDFTKDLRTVVDAVRAEDRTPVLTGVVNLEAGEFFSAEAVARRAELNAATLALADELGLQHAGWGEDYRGVTDTVDGTHRTQIASDRLAVAHCCD